MNTTTETPISTEIPQVFFDLESEACTLTMEMQNIRSLLFFMSDFFEGEDIDPNTTDKARHTDAVYRILHYPQYRGLFCVLLTTAQKAADCAEKVLNHAEGAFEAVRHT